MTDALAKAEQLGLFDTPVIVGGYVNDAGTFVAPHASHRKKKQVKPPAIKPPAAIEPADGPRGTLPESQPEDDGFGEPETLEAKVARRIGERKTAIHGALKDGHVAVRSESMQRGGREDRHALIGPDVSKPGRYRMTRFDKDGPVGHSEYESLDDAVHDAARDGYDPMEPPGVAPTDEQAGSPPADAEPHADDGFGAPAAPLTAFGAPDKASPAWRRDANATAMRILAEKEDQQLDAADKAALALYSGTGGVGDSLNEYYTRPDVATAIWSVLERLGLPDGPVLEPSCGTGVFQHTAPAGRAMVGVELDRTSARIARVLHPHELHQTNFEKFATSDVRLFAGVVGNPPFGPRGSFLADDKKHIARAEQYFIDTALDKTAQGGIVAMVLPSGVMDSLSASRLRQDLLCKGEFLGALRMPNTAFEHSGTEVVTDVVFFRRRAPDVAQALLAMDPAAVAALGVHDDEFVSGRYFEGRGAPQVLGTPEAGWRAKAGMGHDITVTGSMSGVADAIAQFEPESPKAVDMAAIRDHLAGDPAELERVLRAARKPQYEVARLGDTKVVDGVTYVLSGDPPRWHLVGEDVEPAEVTDARAIGAQIRQLQQDPNRLAAAKVREQIDAWTAAHGEPGAHESLSARSRDEPDLLRFLSARKDGAYSDLLAGRQITDDASIEAQADRLSLEGAFAPAALAEASGADPEVIADMLMAGDRYAMIDTPAGPTFQAMGQYLTGNLWPKLDAARSSAETETDPARKAKFEAQAKAVEAAIDPKMLDDVDIALNQGWFQPSLIANWLNAERDARIAETPSEAQWHMPWHVEYEDAIYSVGGGHISQRKLLEQYLNRTGVRKDDLPAIDTMNKEFREWLLSSDQRDILEDRWNRKFRGIVRERYSDAPIEVPGLNPPFDINAYHWSGLRWALDAGKGIIADDVGLGKTGRGLMLSKLLKAYKKAKKPAIVVPKSVLANWIKDAKEWFPGSTIMVVGESYKTDKDGKVTATTDSKTVRDRKLHDIAQNDYDFILISQPVWNELDLSDERKETYTDDDFWTQRAESLKGAKDKKKRKMKEAHDQAVASRDFQKRTEAITFEDTGIDALFLDEGHHYKNLYAARNRYGESPKFLGGSGQSNRALDTQLKTRYVRDQNDGKNVYVLTATPTKNSPLEIYSMLSHVAPEVWESIGIRNSEEFLDMFCEFKTELAADTAGKVEEALCVTGFKNMDVLRSLMKRYIDRRTAVDVGLKIPQRNALQHLVDMTPAQEAEYVRLRELATKGEDSDGNKVHTFSILSQMDKVAMDLALMQKDAGTDTGIPSPKYEAAAEQAIAGARDGGQVLFVEPIASHERLKAELVRRGAKPEQIAIINASATPSSLSRQRVSDGFNAGTIKYVIGNQTMAEGMNLQKRTADIHELDIPWEPATGQQRRGRGLRQGNMNEAVRTHTYLARKSFDNYRYQTVGAKKDWQDQVWNGGDRLENLSRSAMPTREEINIMLAPDPDQAREAWANNRKAAEERLIAGKKAEAGAAYVKFRDLSRSLKGLKNRGTIGAQKLTNQVQRLRAQLESHPYFDAKDALDDPTSAVIAPNGMVFKPGTGLTIHVQNSQPFYAPEGDGPSKWVVEAVNPDDDHVHLRKYAGTAKVRVKAAALQEAKRYDHDPAREANDAAVGDFAGTFAQRAGQFFGGGTSHEGWKAVDEAVRKATVKVAEKHPGWHMDATGRAHMWSALHDAIRGAASHIQSPDIQKMIDAAEVGLNMAAVGLNPSTVRSAQDLNKLSDAVLEAHGPLLQQHLKALYQNYQYGHGHNSQDVLMIGPDGKVKATPSYDTQKLLGTHRFVLPTAADLDAVTAAWKEAEFGRNFKTKMETKRYQAMPGAEVTYDGMGYGEKRNLIGDRAEKMWPGFEKASRMALADEQGEKARAASTFAEKLRHYLAAQHFDYAGKTAWEHETLRDLAEAAKREGIMDKPIGPAVGGLPAGILSNPKRTYVHSGEPHRSSTTTVAAALKHALDPAHDKSTFAEWLGANKQFVEQPDRWAR